MRPTTPIFTFATRPLGIRKNQGKTRAFHACSREAPFFTFAMSKRDVERQQPKAWRNESHASGEHRVAAPAAVGTSKHVATGHVHDDPWMRALGAEVRIETAPSSNALVAQDGSITRSKPFIAATACWQRRIVSTQDGDPSSAQVALAGVAVGHEHAGSVVSSLFVGAGHGVWCALSVACTARDDFVGPPPCQQVTEPFFLCLAISEAGTLHRLRACANCRRRLRRATLQALPQSPATARTVRKWRCLWVACIRRSCNRRQI